MDIKTIVNISSRAWALPILAQLHLGTPARQAPLIAATGATRTAFSQSMEHLIKIGMVERNPGHGHPLRPEYRLTELGRSYGLIASQIHHATKEEEHEILRRNWTLPILVTLNEAKRFGEIKRSLVTISDRALSKSLLALEEQNWISRNVDDYFRPPKPLYLAINTGAQISQVAHA